MMNHKRKNVDGKKFTKQRLKSSLQKNKGL